MINHVIYSTLKSKSTALAFCILSRFPTSLPIYLIKVAVILEQRILLPVPCWICLFYPLCHIGLSTRWICYLHNQWLQLAGQLPLMYRWTSCMPSWGDGLVKRASLKAGPWRWLGVSLPAGPCRWKWLRAWVHTTGPVSGHGDSLSCADCRQLDCLLPVTV